MSGNSTGDAQNSLKIYENSRGGATKKWMFSTGGVRINNAISHLVSISERSSLVETILLVF
jgi:hypothetical protein